MATVNKIVITGGPCAGKSTAMTWIQDHFTKCGYTVLFVPETATELITGGVAPWTCGNMTFQECLAKLQIQKEAMYEHAAMQMDSEKILIVCDRGIPDAKAYLSGAEYATLMKELRTSEVHMRDNYEAVFSLVTAAKGAEEYYQWNDPSKEDTGNNAARTETPEQAREKDDRIISSYTGHPHFRVIDNSTNFHDKMMRLISEIASFLGEPEPFEIERKFLIHYPNINKLEQNPYCNKVEIIQTYLNAPDGDEVRVRQRGANGNYVYIKTTKRKVSEVKRIEIEQRISQDEYLRLLMDADITMHPIRKTRYCLTWENQYFEIDVYPFSKEYAIVEIELTHEDDEIIFPDELCVICEVTDDKAFKNASLAKTLAFDMTGITLPKPEIKWVYEVGREEPEILGSGSNHYNVVFTTDEGKAFQRLNEGGRNYLRRSHIVNGIRETQCWDTTTKQWR